MTSCPLCFLLLLVSSTVLARPNEAEGLLVPTLDITSSVHLGHPLLGDTLGPFSTGIDVTLTCSSSDDSLAFSWWEGGEALQSQDVTVGDQGIGSSITLEALSVSDSGRRLTCKAMEKEVERTVTLHVVESLDVEDTVSVVESLDVQDTASVEESLDVEETASVEESLDVEETASVEESLDVEDTASVVESLDVEETASSEMTGTLVILVNEQTLGKDQGFIDVKSGAGLRLACVLQGSNTPILSWLEDDLDLGAEYGKSSYAASSVYTVATVTSSDSGRRFSCRSEGGPQERVIEIQVLEDNQLETLQIFLICVCAVGILLIAVMATVVVRTIKDYREAVRGQQVTKVSDIFKKYSRLPYVNGSSRDDFVPQLVRGPYKPCTVLLDPEGNEY